MDFAKMFVKGDDENKVTLVKGKDLAAFRKSFRHLDLQPGDKVRFKKGGYKDKKLPAEGEIVEVFSVFPIIRDFSESAGGNHFLDEYDFSVVYKGPEDGEFLIYPFDSRRFELVK